MIITREMLILFMNSEGLLFLYQTAFSSTGSVLRCTWCMEILAPIPRDFMMMNVFEHTCAYARWVHMHRFLSVCLSVMSCILQVCDGMQVANLWAICRCPHFTDKLHFYYEYERSK